MLDSYFGQQQYVIYCSQLRATPSADCNISHIAVGLSNYLIHLTFQFVIVVLVFYSSFNNHIHADRYVHGHVDGHVVFTKGEFAAKHMCLKQCSDPNRTTKY